MVAVDARCIGSGNNTDIRMALQRRADHTPSLLPGPALAVAAWKQHARYGAPRGIARNTGLSPFRPRAALVRRWELHKVSP